MIAAIIAIVGGCQKDELGVSQPANEAQPQAVVTNPMFVGLNGIAFSVEDNRLVFESEEEFQKSIDFLAQLGDENFSAFEKEIGFESLKSSYEEKEANCPIDDELFSTLLNPDMQIIVEHYLFTLNPKDEKVFARFIILL